MSYLRIFAAKVNGNSILAIHEHSRINTHTHTHVYAGTHTQNYTANKGVHICLRVRELPSVDKNMYIPLALKKTK